MYPINLTQTAALLQATPQTLRSELSPLPPEVMSWKPTPKQWCINEIIGHLIETDERAFAGRIRIIISQDRPTLKDGDADAIIAQRGDAQKDSFDLIAELEALREDHAKLVLSLIPEQLACVGVHPRAGELRVIDFVEEWPYHDRAHLKQILHIIQQFLWSEMGPMKKFLDPPE